MACHPQRRLKLPAFLAVSTVAVVGCPGDDGSIPTETSTTTESGGSSTGSTNPSTSGTTPPPATDATSTNGTTTGGTGSTTGDETDTGLVAVCGTYDNETECDDDPLCRWYFGFGAFGGGPTGTGTGTGTGSTTTGGESFGYCDVDCGAFEDEETCEQFDQCDWFGESCEYAAI